MGLGVVAGGVGIALGYSEGRLYLEYPLWADALLLLGMLGFARGIGEAARSAVVDLGAVRWYAVAASWWLILVFVAGNIPGLTGLASAYQTSFFRASLIGLWLASAGVAVVYDVIPRLAGREAFTPTRLTLLGFWSLAFVWALTAPTDLTYGPAPDWLETVGVIFALGLLIPTAVIFTDLVLAMRHRWGITRGDMTMRFAMLGLALFVVWPLLNLMLAFRASSAVVQFTDWVAATEQIALYGAFTAWLIAFFYFAAPEVLGRGPRRSLARTHYFATVFGLFVWAGASLVAGVTSGLTWVGIANEAAVPAAGPGWRNTLDAVEVLHPIAFGGFAVFALAQLLFLFNLLTGGETVVRQFVEVDDDGPDPELVLDRAITPGRLRLGVIGLFAVAAVLVWVVPTLETTGAEATLLADTSRTYEAGTPEAEGREIYMAEGCWYCHTQEVRGIVTDVGLGAVSVPGDYVYESPVLTGVRRLGPDLMHVGSRDETDDTTWVVAHLADPRSQRPWSTMPAYDHLSGAELDALAAYIVGAK
jgi:cytochrome c oxidase cbb3-type subunit I/II